MKKQNKPEAGFASEADARAFWEHHDSTDYVNWSDAKNVVFSNLKPSTKTSSITLPQQMLDDSKNSG